MNNAIKYLFAIILFCFIIIGCDKDYDFTYDIIVREEPVNLEEINSVHDDYNSALPYEAFREGIYFSTNRNTNGNNFDFIYKDLDISYHQRDDAINITHVSDENSNHILEEALDAINTEFDEFGPQFHWAQFTYQYLLYANNEAGNFDIKYAAIEKGDPSSFDSNISYTSLNTEFDELYPCIAEDEIYFCSNRENEIFNIYSTSFNDMDINPDEVSTNNDTINKNTILSSDKDDKCPFIENDLMVFTSDREGGFGGFDLYYSIRTNGIWSEPINFGETINSESDEYRPVIVPFFESETTMLIFSSNREGGKGGFDLYAVRINL